MNYGNFWLEMSQCLLAVRPILSSSMELMWWDWATGTAGLPMEQSGLLHVYVQRTGTAYYECLKM